MFTYYKTKTYFEARKFAEFLWENGFGAEVKTTPGRETYDVIGNDPAVGVFLTNRS